MAKQKVSERGYIGSDDMAGAKGATYSLVQQDGVDDKGKPKFAELHTFKRQWDASNSDSLREMLWFAIFGFHTKVGNVVNTVLHNEKQPGTLDDAVNAVKEFLNGDGPMTVWREPGAVVGPRYDVGILATAIAAVTGKPEAEYSGKMDWRVDQRTGARVAPGADGTYAKGAITYPAFAMRNKAVAAKYAELGGATGKEVEASAL